MKKVLITGAAGQIGTALTERLRHTYGVDNVIATNIEGAAPDEDGIFEVLDVRDRDRLFELSKRYQVDSIINLAALLSVVGEKNPNLLWDVNMNGLYNCLEVAHALDLLLFTPSSIAAFGPQTPKDHTPQDTIQRPTSIYGVSKVSGELLCDYYFRKFNVDTRGVRFPGLISYSSMPGGGTTDYAVHIYHAAVESGAFTCGLKADTYLDMMYMPDALDAIVQICEADPTRLIHRNAFNITAMSFCPSEIGAAIKRRKPNFVLDYDIDPMKQAIADSWPNSIDDSCARSEWDWNPKYDLEQMTDDMLNRLEAAKKSK